MRKLKSFLSIALAVMLVLGSISIPFAASADEIFNDVNKDNTYYKAITDLVGKGIIDGYLNEDGSKSFKPDATITRAEFSKLLSVTINGGVVGIATSTKFEDVNSDPTVSWAIPYIADANNAGIINGYEDGTFRPKNPVSYAEAVKMIVCALGYGPVVKTPEGGQWYEGYITIANQIGVAKGAVALADSQAPRGLVAQLVSNMITAPVLEYKGLDAEGNPEYVQNEDKTIQGEHITGQLVAVFAKGATEQYTLSGVSENLSVGQVKVRTNTGDMIFEVGDSKTKETLNALLGYKVDITYEKSLNIPVAKTLEESRNANTIYPISSEQLESINGTVVTYENESGRNSNTVSISSNLEMIYNGKGVGSLSLVQKVGLISNLIGTSLFGDVRFIDNNNDGSMDVAFVTSYDTYYVSTVTSSTYTVQDNLALPARAITLNEKLGTVTINSVQSAAEISFKKISSDGKTFSDASFGSITEKSIISVAASYDNSIVEVIISDRKASGEVREINANTLEDIVIGSGSSKYSVSSYYRSMYQTAAQNQVFTNGSSGTFYIDFMGNIAAVLLSTSGGASNFGYLMEFVPATGIGEREYITLYNTSGDEVSYYLADNVRVNNVNQNRTAVGSMLSTAASTINTNKPAPWINGSTTYAQLIRYEKNSSNEITALAFVGQGLYLSKKYEDPSDTTITYSYSSTSYGFNIGGTNVAIGDSTHVFFVPDVNRSDDTKYSYSKGRGMFIHNTGYKVEVYNLDSGVAGAVVVYGGSTKRIKGNTDGVIVATKSSVGNGITKIGYYALGSNELNYAQEKTSGMTSGVEIGDVIKIAVNTIDDETKGKINEIVELEKVYIHSTDQLYNPANDSGVQSALPATTHVLHIAYGNEPNYYNLFKGTVKSKTSVNIGIVPDYVVDDGQGNMILTPPITEASYAANITTLPTYVYDSTQSDMNNIIRYVENANELVAYDDVIATNRGATASKVVALREGSSGVLDAIIIYLQ